MVSRETWQLVNSFKCLVPWFVKLFDIKENNKKMSHGKTFKTFTRFRGTPCISINLILLWSKTTAWTRNQNIRCCHQINIYYQQIFLVRSWFRTDRGGRALRRALYLLTNLFYYIEGYYLQLHIQLNWMCVWEEGGGLIYWNNLILSN